MNGDPPSTEDRNADAFDDQAIKAIPMATHDVCGERYIALKFTRFETEAVLHQLRQWHRFAGWLDRRMLDALAPRANARARMLYEALAADETGTLMLLDAELDREILVCVVEHSSWLQTYATRSHQKQSAAFAALQSIAEKIEHAFQLGRRRIRVPLE